MNISKAKNNHIHQNEKFLEALSKAKVLINKWDLDTNRLDEINKEIIEDALKYKNIILNLMPMS